MPEPSLTTAFRVGYRWRCTLAINLAEILADSPDNPVILAARWHPKTPQRLSAQELADYRRGRDALVAEIARAIGGNILVAETGTGAATILRPHLAPKPCPN